MNGNQQREYLGKRVRIVFDGINTCNVKVREEYEAIVRDVRKKSMRIERVQPIKIHDRFIWLPTSGITTIEQI